MGLAVLGEQGKILLVDAPNTFKYFPHIRRRFCVPQITLDLPAGFSMFSYT